MAESALSAHEREPARDHGFHALAVRRVVAETADACSLVLDVPEQLREAFSYEAGQFCTLRVWIDGEPHLRCYSMSSSPATDDDFTVTVKRVPDGIVSNWINDFVAPGTEIETTFPAGVFCLTERGGDVVAFAAGSGITPIISLLKSAVATTSRRVRVLYANRDLDSTIFRAEIDSLAAQHPDRIEVRHHLDVEDGYIDSEAVRGFAGTISDDADVYICGPGPFMDVVEDTLIGDGVERSAIHIERFTPAGELSITEVASDDAGSDGATAVTIELDGRTDTTEHRAGTTILQVARQLGMSPPFSCESGSCATCMARLVEGSVKMHVNNALTDQEVDDGWVLTCQSVPTSSTVRVVYGFE